jgi:protein phosphatase
LVRATNEDAFGSLPEQGIVVVADGMGGYRAGEVASQIAVDSVVHYLLKRVDSKTPLERCLDEAQQAIEHANQAIGQAVHDDPELGGMGTTVVLGMFRNAGLGFAWVGDSRLYLLRDHRLIQLTTDHTLVQEMVNQRLFASVEAAMAAGVGENVLIRALGTEEPLLVDIGSVELVAGDVLLFCSDGLNHMVPNSSIEQVLNTREADLETKVDQLVQLACSAGGRDNITVVLVRVATHDT